MKAIKTTAPIWKGLSLIMSNHLHYNSKFLVMPRQNAGRRVVATSSVVFTVAVIEWNYPTYRICFTAKQGKDNVIAVLTPLSPSPAYRIPELY